MAEIGSTGTAKAFSLAEIKVATNQFKQILGKGGFGPVYYGKLADGQEVAVKVADGSEASKQGEKEFFNEVRCNYRVPTIVEEHRVSEFHNQNTVSQNHWRAHC